MLADVGLVRNTLILSAVVTAPALVAPPPLYTKPNQEAQARLERRALTPLGYAGKMLFSSHCAECHGSEARGTIIGPSLHHEYYKPANLSRQAFHLAVTEGVKAQRWSFGDMPGAPLLSFNDIEVIARYVRELQYPARYR